MASESATPVELPIVHASARYEGVPASREESTSDRIVSINKIHVPMLAWVGALVVCLGGVISMTTVWAKTVSHAEDKQVHIDPEKATAGGGMAYKTDIISVRADMKQAILESQQKTRMMLKEMKITCTKTEGGMACRVTELPETY